MDKPTPPPSQPARLGRYGLMAASAWTAVVVVFLVWHIRQEESRVLEIGRVQAEIAAEKDMICRKWNAASGGVYAAVSEQLPPNPYLDVPERDLVTPSGRSLTLVNPAYMTRQLHELIAKTDRFRGHITSLKPIRPENRPDEWEEQALKALEHGQPEVSGVAPLDGATYLRLMRPLRAEPTCLKCHGSQGGNVGDLRGGLCVSVPLAPLEATARSDIMAACGAHAVIWVLGLAGIGIGTRRLRRDLNKRLEAEARVRHLNAVLRGVRNVSQLTAKEHDRKKLIEGACQGLVETGGFPGSWIVLTDESRRPIMWAEAGLGTSFGPVAAGLEAGALPAGASRAMQQSGVVFGGSTCVQCPDGTIPEPCLDAPVMTVRLEHGEIVYGVLTGIAAKGYELTADERALLNEVADDIAFALHNLAVAELGELAEQSFRKSEERFRDFVELLPQPLFECDLSARITLANRSALEIFGVDREDLERGLVAFDLIAPQSREQCQRDFLAVLTGELNDRREYMAQRKDGSTFPAVVYPSRTLQDGAASGIRGILLDVTDQKRAEEQLKKSIAELERFNRMAVGRERRMIELKRQVNEMARKAGIAPPYDLSFAENVVPGGAHG